MKQFKPALRLFLTASIGISMSSAAQQHSANEWVIAAEKAAYYAGDTAKSQARMLIVDGQGRKQLRQFTLLRRDIEDNGDQQMLVFFSRPSDVKNTVFRVEKHKAANASDDRWLYLPALDLVKRIASSDKRTSFVGSHFYYEDVSGRNTEDDLFSILKDNDDVVTLQAVPKRPNTVEFVKYEVDIDKTTLLPISIRYFDNQNDIYRKVDALEISTIEGHPTVTKSRISDFKTNGYTLMEFRNVTYDLTLPEAIFSERSLRQPPRRLIK